MIFSTTVTFKTLITQHQDQLTLIHMAKKMTWDPVKKERVHQFYVGYMKYP